MRQGKYAGQDRRSATVPRHQHTSIEAVNCVVFVASEIVITEQQSPSTTHQLHELYTPTKSCQHIDELRRQHDVIKPFKSPRRKWLVSLAMLDSVK